MSIILSHLGESVPLYLEDCVKQISLWNMNALEIYIILDPCHKTNTFFRSLLVNYSAILVYTDSLEKTSHHRYFIEHFQGDTGFRKGYWKHVKERFFYIEECMNKFNLTSTISMEYDVLVYTDLLQLISKLKAGPQTLRMVRDNDLRGHPAFMYIPTSEHIQHFNVFIVSIIEKPLEDMQALAAYADNYSDRINYLPLITETRNKSIANRRSTQGHISQNTYYLSQSSEDLMVLFDSLVVGQWVGGIDSRNTGGHKITKYENESALYNINEMKFQWKKNPETFLWQPFLDGRLLVTIHMHSKALKSFLSDRPDYPSDNYNVSDIYTTLLPN